jgi:hypothetical protein
MVTDLSPSRRRTPPANAPSLVESLQIVAHRSFERRDGLLVPPIEDPLLDPRSVDEPRRDKHSHVLAHGWLAHAQLLGDENAAHAVGLEIAVDLRPEMLGRIFQPVENLQTPFVVYGAQATKKLCRPNYILSGTRARHVTSPTM